MTPLEMMIGTCSVAAAAATVGYVLYVVRHAGRDRPYDPERVKRLVETAPMERLDNVLAK